MSRRSMLGVGHQPEVESAQLETLFTDRKYIRYDLPIAQGIIGTISNAVEEIDKVVSFPV